MRSVNGNVARTASLGYARGTMERTQLLEMFKAKASEVAERDFDGLTETSVIADMGVDSLAMLEVVGEMERELEVQIPDDNLVGIETVAQLLDVVEKRIQAS